ncbi:MAG: AAA family ATPase [Clostridiales bacterium]|jgi:predicted ATPase|nr:AAA family ATPase [Clostridiales bacterium]
MYLEKLILPDGEAEYAAAFARRKQNGGYLDNGYPCGMFGAMGLSRIDFENVTVIYGGSGSGKSTLLNIIADKLRLKRNAPFNRSEMFPLYADACECKMQSDGDGGERKIPDGSAIITSDDVFEYMLAARAVNEEVSENTEQGKVDYAGLKFGETFRFSGVEDYDNFRLQILSRKKSLTRRKFLRRLAGVEVKLNSNGETAIDYFNAGLQNDTFYCLDEPENSLSPVMQLRLKKLIETKSRYCGCQFVIATHSPFILAVNGAKIYNLDLIPVTLSKWWQVENTKTYFDFFYRHKDLFLKDE